MCDYTSNEITEFPLFHIFYKYRMDFCHVDHEERITVRINDKIFLKIEGNISFRRSEVS